MPESSPSRRAPSTRPASQRVGASRPPPPPPPTPEETGSDRLRRRPGDDDSSRRGRPRPGTGSVRSAPPPPPPPPPPEVVERGTGRGTRPQPQRRAAAPPTSRKTMFLAMGGVALLAVLLIVLAAIWGPMQRSMQLSRLDANLANVEEARRLAKAFALENGPRSEYVRTAVLTHRGPIEARIVLCRTGKHLDLLVDLLGAEGVNARQRAEILGGLAEDWPEDGKDAPELPGALASWLADPKMDDGVAIAAAQLFAAANPPDAAKVLKAGAVVSGGSDARAVACAESLARMINRDNGGGLANLLDCLRGPHRASIAAANVVAEAVKNQAGPESAEQLLGMLGDADIQPVVLAGLAGPRMELGADPARRAAFAAKLAPSLALSVDDAVLAGALRTVRRHQLIEARPQLLALLGRLGKHQLPGLDGNDFAAIIGGLASDRTPELAAASNELVTGLGERLADDKARLVAAGALAEVQARNLPALAGAMRELVGYPDDSVCSDALAVIVGKRFERLDLVAESRKRGWGPLLADDARRKARYEAIRTWLKENGENTTVRAGKDKLLEAKEVLGRYRDEVRGWLDAPPPLGLGKNDILGLSNQINVTLDSVLKSSGGL